VARVGVVTRRRIRRPSPGAVWQRPGGGAGFNVHPRGL